MTMEQYRAMQQRIITCLKVKPLLDIEKEIAGRIQFLKDQLLHAGRSSYILGISGGIDSTVAGRLTQLAIESLRTEGYKAQFIAMRLPYGVQKDEEHAQQACDFIQADEVMTVNIKPTCDSLMHALLDENLYFKDVGQQDFILGNIKARQRMVVQYAVAGTKDGLVIGTDHAAEALMGFFTKYGDGACDLAPLTGLNKRQIQAIGCFLNAPHTLVEKCPTADLESLYPLRPDEEAFGVTYEKIDDFLEGKIVPESVYKLILRTFVLTEHKRSLPVTPSV